MQNVETSSQYQPFGAPPSGSQIAAPLEPPLDELLLLVPVGPAPELLPPGPLLPVPDVPPEEPGRLPELPLELAGRELPPLDPVPWPLLEALDNTHFPPLHTASPAQSASVWQVAELEEPPEQAGARSDRARRPPNWSTLSKAARGGQAISRS